ncbi:hypothetical protein [Luteolibacter luteus]|uniref:Uncharacterized protein n=1 Tax=Luteolibacter luteus TaxID=2728835 RepID=A0A858REI6_9BACT|nr:hypothetical protein [Luteolibacter luteus]QJE95237.1 hypothetical protein HHL09_05425 [Luteolibacter luteus]
MRRAATPFPVEQKEEAPAFKSELDLPDPTPRQVLAIYDIKDHGGIYHRHSNGSWYPPGRETASARQTDRTIKGLIAKCWLTVTKTHEGRPVAVRLTFP